MTTLSDARLRWSQIAHAEIDAETRQWLRTMAITMLRAQKTEDANNLRSVLATATGLMGRDDSKRNRLTLALRAFQIEHDGQPYTRSEMRDFVHALLCWPPMSDEAIDVAIKRAVEELPQAVRPEFAAIVAGAKRSRRKL